MKAGTNIDLAQDMGYNSWENYEAAATDAFEDTQEINNVGLRQVEATPKQVAVRTSLLGYPVITGD